jgi:hypothetical protein
MGTSKQWKYEELQVAKKLNTSRKLMKGTDEKSDVIHDLFMVDAKLRKKWNVQKDFRVLKAAADKEFKIPVLTLREPGQKLRLCVIQMDTFVSLCNGAGITPDSTLSELPELQECDPE